MTYSEKLAARVREALAGSPRVAEKKMFGGLAFMLDDKMCVTIGESRIMVRVDPAGHDALAKADGCTTMTMGGKEYKGYLRVDESVLKSKKQLDAWVARAVAFNKHARKSKGR